MISKLAAGVIVVIVVVGVGIAAYVLTRPPEKYELTYDYQVGEYYVYETTATTTMDNTVSTSLSSYTMQVTGVVGNQITFKYISRENIGPPYLATTENVEVTMGGTMTNKGKTISQEIENVVPSELRDNVESYENSMMAYSQLFENLYMLPSAPISIGQKWSVSISGEIPYGTIYMPLTGQGSVSLAGQESITVKAGTFDCWRLESSATVSGEQAVDNQYTAMVDMTVQWTSWLNKQNCANVKSTSSMTMSAGGDNLYSYTHSSESVTELVEYGTI